uniref:Transposase (Putative), gypsy type n=1 Tax=Tanacetum cinerariifolium TaxID=118510 RepID=A0A6L2K5P3_TANCI|nr:hypothetical protein [Tanacetum cinerariifolium]
MVLFAFIRHADLTKVRISEKHIEEGQTPLLDSTKGRVVSLSVGDDQVGSSVPLRDQTEEGVHVVQDEGVNIVADDEIQAIVVNKPKGTRRKRKAASGASGSVLPPKKLREDHNTSTDAGASTAGKSLAALQGLLEHNTLAVEVGVTAVTTVSFVTSFMTLTPEREGVGILTSYVEVSSFDRSLVPPVPVITMVVATTTTTGASTVLVFGTSTRPVNRNVFVDFTSPSATGPDVAGPSQPASAELSADTFYYRDHLAPPVLFPQLCGMDYDQLFTEFNVVAARHICLGLEVRMRCKHNLRERKRFEDKCARHGDLLKKKDIEIADLKAHMSLKEAEAAKAIRLSFDELRIKAAALESQKNNLNDQVCLLETTYSRLRDQVYGYELFKEQFEVVQDEHVKVLSDHVVELDSELMRYVAALKEAIGRAIDEGMQTRLVACIDHGKVGRGLADVAAYNPYVKAEYVSAVLAFRNLYFDFLSLLESQKGASIADIMDSLCLEGPFTESPEINRLQPSHEQLILPFHRKEDNVVIGETSLYESLDAIHARVHKIKKGASSYRLSFSDTIGHLVNPLSSENLVGEASTSGVPVTVAVTTALSTTFSHKSFLSPISVANYGVMDVEPQLETSHSPKFIFEQEILETSPEHPVTSLACPSLRHFLFVGISSHLLLLYNLSFKASLFSTMSISVTRRVGTLISAGITASVLYVSENRVSPLLDLIMVQCADRTCGTSSIQSLLLLSNRAFIPSPKLLFALFTKLLLSVIAAAKRWSCLLLFAMQILLSCRLVRSILRRVKLLCWTLLKVVLFLFLLGTIRSGHRYRDVELRDQIEEGVHVVQDEGVNIMADDEIQAIVVNKPKGTRRKRKATSGASGSVLPPKKLREDHNTSTDAGASTAGKSLAALQGLLKHNTLAVEVGVTAVTTMSFVTSFMTLTSEREGVGILTSYVEVSSFDRSSVPPVPVMTMVVATTATAGASTVLVFGTGTRPVNHNVFMDSASPSATGPDVAGPSQPASAELSADTFYACRSMVDHLAPPVLFPQLCGMDYDQLFTEFNVVAARHICLGLEVRMRCKHNLREKKRFEDKCARQGDLLKKKDIEIANLKAHMSLKEAEAAKAIRLSFDELRIKAAALESQKNNLTDQVCLLETTYSRLRDQVYGYELFKEQFEVVQDEHVKCWILSRDIRLAIMKCLQSSGYVSALREAIGRAIDEGMQTRLVACIDHGKVGRGLADVAAYNPYVEAEYVFAVLAFRNLYFDFLSLLESQKGASIADIMDSLCLEGPFTESPEINRLQPSHEQLILPFHRKEDNVVIGETSLYESLDAVHARVHKIKKGASSYRLSFSDTMGPLVNPLSSENLVGEASTSGVPVTVAVTTALSTTFSHKSFLPPISVANYGVMDVEPQPETSHSPKFIFEQEILETSPEYPVTSLACPSLRHFLFVGISSHLLLLYVPRSLLSVTLYDPSHLGHNFPPSSAWLASLFRYNLSFKASSFSTMSISVAQRCADRTCGTSSIQSLLLLSNRVFIPSPKLLFALSTKLLVCGCLMEAKCWRIFSFSHQSLNGLSLNFFPLSDTISIEMLRIPHRRNTPCEKEEGKGGTAQIKMTITSKLCSERNPRRILQHARRTMVRGSQSYTNKEPVGEVNSHNVSMAIL